MNELAEAVRKTGERVGLKVTIKHIENPRVESEDHYYNPDHQRLLDLGLEPHCMVDALEHILQDLLKYGNRVEAKIQQIEPQIRWR